MLLSNHKVKTKEIIIISSFQLRRSFFWIWPFLQSKIRSWFNNPRERFSNFKRSWKEPFLYLVLVLAIFLLTSFLKSAPFSEIKAEKGLFLEPFNEVKTQLFITPREKVESPDLSLIQKNSLLTVVPPVIVTPQVLGQIIDQPEKEIRKEIVEYIVQPGETLSSIGEKFGLSLNTLLWANDLNENSILKPGQKLIILPVSGVIHQVKKDDTLSQIAKNYNANLKEILAFNDLSSENDIFIGDILIIPNGKLPPKIPLPQLAPLASSFLFCPLSSCQITQGLHWHNAIDFEADCQDSIYAPAAGIVQRVKYGWNGGAGNYLTLLHPNGVVTFYGHLSASLVKPGDQVSQGQKIALIGGQPGAPGAGRSTGCHLHFGVQGAKNPFAK